MARIVTRLSDLYDMISKADANALRPDRLDWLKEMVEGIDVDRMGFEGAWIANDALKFEMVKYGSTEYLFTRLQREAAREKVGGSESWSAYVPKERLDDLIKTEPERRNADWRATAVEFLVQVFQERSVEGTRSRAFERLRSRYTSWSFGVFTIAFVLCIFVSVAAIQALGGYEPLPFTVMVVTAIFGGALVGLLNTRDSRTSTSELRRSWWVLMTQPVIGGAMALILYFALGSGLLSFGSTSVGINATPTRYPVS